MQRRQYLAFFQKTVLPRNMSVGAQKLYRDSLLNLAVASFRQVNGPHAAGAKKTD